MKVYLMRHGEALHPAVDSEMRLSSRGVKDARRMGEYLQELKTVVDACWHSPKARAIQTAQCVAEVLGFDSACLEMKPELTPEGDVDRIFSQIQSARDSGRFKNLLIVSHMPFLPKLTARLTAGAEEADYETASVVCLFDRDGVWTRDWSRCPAQV